MNIKKNEIRLLVAIASGRYSDAKQSVQDLEAIFNDVKIKLQRAKEAQSKAENLYNEALFIEENLCSTNVQS